MRAKGLCLSMVIISIGALAPLRAPAQSRNSSDETRDLRKLVEEMRIQMSKMQAEIDQLKGTKTETTPTQLATASTVQAAREYL
jgi:Tfp pilus assembly protein PilV